MFWKKKKGKVKQDGSIILGMLMLQNETTFSLNALVTDFSENYIEKIDELTGDDATAAFTIAGETVAIGYMPVPIPAGDIEGTALYAYNWPSVLEDVKEHKSHLIVSLLASSEDPIKRFKLFTQVVCSLLRTTDATGVYMGNQSLLIPKEDYLSDAAFMSDEYLPLNLWIYFGLRHSSNSNSGYTYGLKEFGKLEMEVLDSSKNLEQVREFLFNIAHYVLEYDVTFEDGQTCGVSEDERITISLSIGKLVESKTFKLAY